MSEETNFLKKKLLETGFPLEVLIYSKLKSQSKFVKHQDYYYDLNEKITRSIDLIADLFTNPLNWSVGDPAKFFIDSSMVIECKKSKKHWVFFPIKGSFGFRNGQMCAQLHNDFGFYVTSEIDLTYKGHQINNPLGLSSAYKVIDEDRKNPNDIYEATMQLIKYIQYNKNMILSNELNKKIPYRYQVYLWYPIIVFEGKMWNAYLKDGEIDVIESTNHVILSYETKSINSLSSNCYLIDIINPEYIEELYKSLKEEAITIDKILEENKFRILDQYKAS